MTITHRAAPMHSLLERSESSTAQRSTSNAADSSGKPLLRPHSCVLASF